jgi:hypothetical protein
MTERVRIVGATNTDLTQILSEALEYCRIARTRRLAALSRATVATTAKDDASIIEKFGISPR